MKKRKFNSDQVNHVNGDEQNEINMNPIPIENNTMIATSSINSKFPTDASLSTNIGESEALARAKSRVSVRAKCDGPMVIIP